MSTCLRNGAQYKRHKFAGRPTCKFCYLPKRKHERTGRQAFIKKTAVALCVKAEPPMSMKAAKFHARALWDQKRALA